MIFTIGFTEIYNKYFLEDEHPKKLGRHLEFKNGECGDWPQGYPGGCVWKTFEEAKKNCPEGFSVWGVDADWELHTAECPEWSPGVEGERSLLNDSNLVRLNNE